MSRTSGAESACCASEPDPRGSVEQSVRERYSAAARAVEPALCCSVSYDAKVLAAIPREIVERDYGCGDPTPFLRPGDVVLDLGCGGGKVCYIAAQLVGPAGKVIGVDCNLDMLALARKYRDDVAQRLGYCNVEFRCGMIQDLRLDLDLLAEELGRNPVRDQRSWLEGRTIEERLRRERVLIADASIDCVVSNCVLNLVRPQDRLSLFSELHRVLKPGGRAAISDIVATADVPDRLQQDSELWSSCVSGAFRQDRFVDAFRAAGFDTVAVAQRAEQPWRVIDGIEFRSITVLACKAGPAGAALQTITACCAAAGPCC